MLYRFFIASVMCLLMSHDVSADISSTETVFSGTELEKDARLINLHVDRTTGVIMLDNNKLIEDDAPATGVPEGYDYRGSEWKEDLKKGIVIKKILLLDDPRAWSGRLVFKGIEVKGNTTPLHISLNGVEFLRPASQKAAPYCFA